MPMPHRPFELYVHKTARCWLWTGPKSPRYGYGRYHPRPNVRVQSHRWAWEQVNGRIPKGMHVCHTCDTPLCVRPSHLFLGTQQINMADKTAKGRQLKGEQIPQAKLTPPLVLAIRASLLPQKVTAARYNVSQQLVSAICCRKVWKHI